MWIFPVDQFQSSDAAVLYQQRRTENGFGDKSGIFIDGLGEVRVLAHVPHQLAGPGDHGLADDPLVRFESQPGNIDRPGALPANQFGVIVLQQKYGCGFGVHIDQQLLNGILQCQLDIE
jgi:hypothetical protein